MWTELLGSGQIPKRKSELKMSYQYEKPEVFNTIVALIQLSEIDPELLFAILEIFWPAFIEKDGYIFLKDRFSEDYYHRLIDEDSNPELWINLLTIEYFFPEMDDWEEQSICFAKSLVPIWEAKLKSYFPEKKFTVKYLCDEEVGDYGLTFYQTKDGSD